MESTIWRNNTYRGVNMDIPTTVKQAMKETTKLISSILPSVVNQLPNDKPVVYMLCTACLSMAYSELYLAALEELRATAPELAIAVQEIAKIRSNDETGN